MIKNTLKRFLAFFLCLVMCLSLIPLNLSKVQAADGSGLGTNPDCNGKHKESGSAQGYCLDIGFGQCMPYKIIKEDVNGSGKTITAYLYEVDTGYRIDMSLLNVGGSAVEGKTGQFFYWPQCYPEGSYTTGSGESVLPTGKDVYQDLSHLKENGIATASKVPNMNVKTGYLWHEQGLEFTTNREAHTYPVNKDENGKSVEINSYKILESSHPLNSWTSSSAEAKNRETAFLRFGEYSVVPRYVMNSIGNPMSYIGFPNDNYSSGVNKTVPSTIDQYPCLQGEKRGWFGRGSVNAEWLIINGTSGSGSYKWTEFANELFDDYVPETEADKKLFTNSNGHVKYLNPDNPNLTKTQRDKILALFSTVQTIDAMWGSQPISVRLEDFDPASTLSSKASVHAENRGIYLKTGALLNTANPAKGWFSSYCPGPLTQDDAAVASKEYIYASTTAKAMLFMLFFEINGYVGGGGYATLNSTRDDGSYYQSYQIPKIEIAKDLTMWGGIDQAKEENEFYSAGMWKPQDKYKETWENMKDDNERSLALENMTKDTFIDNFEKVNPKTEKQEDGTYAGGLLEYDYPYVWQNSISLKDSGDSNSIAAQSYHNNFKTLIALNTLGTTGKAIYDRNQAALKGEGSASDRTVSVLGSSVTNKSMVDTANPLPVGKEVEGVKGGQAVNNLLSETVGRRIMRGDKEVVETPSLAQYVNIYLTGSRLWAYNVRPHNGLEANTFISGPLGLNAKNLSPLPESDEDFKFINVNVYRRVQRTPKVEDLYKNGTKPDKNKPYYVAYSALLSDEDDFYRADSTPERLQALKDMSISAPSIVPQGLAKYNDNGNLSNDSATVVYMMGDASDNKRNLVLYQAVVKDENGQTVATIDSKPDDNTYYVQLPDLNAQDIKDGKAKNYYVEWQMKYENLNPKKLPTQSFETDLGTIGYYKQNIKGFNDSNGENYETSTNLKSYWDITNGLDIGKYDLSVSAKGYTQATGYDNRIVPMAELVKLASENKQKMATADYIIQIPRKYDNKDNTNLSDWETLKIHFEQKVGTLTDPDNAVTKITLTCHDHKQVFVGDPNTLVRIHQGCIYDAEITVTRVGGVGETNLNLGTLTAFDGSPGHGQNNSLELRGYVGTVPIGKTGNGAATGNEFTYGLYDSSKTNCSGNLTKIGDYATFKLLNLEPTDTGYIEINAFFDPVDIAQDNNYMTARFGGASDFVLENLEISQDVINLPQGQSQTTEVRIRFSAEIGLNYDRESDPNGRKDPTLSPTKVVVLMFEKGLNDFTYNQNNYRVVYQDNDVKLSPNSGPIQISGTLGYGASPNSEGSPIAFRKDSSYRFIAIINGGNSTANGNLGGSMTHRFSQFQTFFYETDNHNNESQHEMTVIPAPCSGGDCDIKPYCWEKKNGLCGKAHTRNSWTVTFYYTECPTEKWYTCCSGDPSVCSQCCTGINCRSWTTAKTFTETFEIQGWFRSVDTNEQWVRASSNAAVVRAGHWFDFKAITIYNTDRANMPPPDPYGGCAWLSRSPGYSQPSAYRWVRIVMDNPTGGQKKIYNSFKSGWTQEFMPQRYTVPESTMNLTITFLVDVDEFKGYWVDREHPKLELCDCTVYTMKVQNPLPIIDGTNVIS